MVNYSLVDTIVTIWLIFHIGKVDTRKTLLFCYRSAAHWYHSHCFLKIVWFCILAPPITFTTTSSMLPLTNCILSIVLSFGNNRVVLAHSHSNVDVDRPFVAPQQERLDYTVSVSLSQD